MASIKLGPIASDIRGSIGGTVFSRNGGGAYAKQRVKPTNPNSMAQQFVRSIISACITAWTVLSSAVRTNWATYAKNVTLVNRLGDAINVSGYNMFCRTKTVCDLIGQAVPAAAPTNYTLGEQDETLTFSADATNNKIIVAFTAALAWAHEVGGYLLCYMGVPQNPTVYSYDGPFKYFGLITGAVTPPSSPATLDSYYQLTAGQRIFCQFRILRADGRLSTPFKAECLAAGAPLVAPAAAGTYAGSVLTTVLTFPQVMDVGSLPAAGDFKVTAGSVVGLAHTLAVWTNSTHLTLTVTTAVSPVGTGHLDFAPGVIPLITAAGGVYPSFSKAEIVGGS